MCVHEDILQQIVKRKTPVLNIKSCLVNRFKIVAIKRFLRWENGVCFWAYFITKSLKTRLPVAVLQNKC
jgi:hypothetical protein